MHISDYKRVGSIRMDEGKFTHRLRDPVMRCIVISFIPRFTFLNSNNHHNTPFPQMLFDIQVAMQYCHSPREEQTLPVDLLQMYTMYACPRACY